MEERFFSFHQKPFKLFERNEKRRLWPGLSTTIVLFSSYIVWRSVESERDRARERESEWSCHRIGPSCRQLPSCCSMWHRSAQPDGGRCTPAKTCRTVTLSVFSIASAQLVLLPRYLKPQQQPPQPVSSFKFHFFQNFLGLFSVNLVCLSLRISLKNSHLKLWFDLVYCGFISRQIASEYFLPTRPTNTVWS